MKKEKESKKKKTTKKKKEEDLEVFEFSDNNLEIPEDLLKIIEDINSK